MTILLTVAGLRVAEQFRSAHHDSGPFPFVVASPTRLLLLVLMAIGFLATWQLLYRLRS